VTRFAGAVAAGLALGALGHAALSRSPVRPPADRAVAGMAPPALACASSISPADLAALRGELARLLDERLGARSGAPSSSPPPADTPDEPRPETVAAMATTRQLIDAALVRGSWQDSDRQAFHAALVAMDDAQRGAAISQLLTAINEGRLHTEVVGPVL
jgi:hypothetical protein